MSTTNKMNACILERVRNAMVPITRAFLYDSNVTLAHSRWICRVRL